MTDDPKERAQRVMERFEEEETVVVAPMVTRALNQRLWAFAVAFFEEVDEQ